MGGCGHNKNMKQSTSKSDWPDVRRQAYVGVHKFITRPNSDTIWTMEKYYPSIELRSLRGCLRRSATRRGQCKLDRPVHHEIHLFGATVAAATVAVCDPDVTVATVFTVHGAPKWTRIRNNSQCVIYGEPGDEKVYFVAVWQDVLYDPMREKVYTGSEQTKRKLDRCKYPRSRLGRVEGGNLVKYLLSATDKQSHIIMAALGRTEKE